MMLPALIDKTNKSVLFGPEAISYYIVEVLGKQPEFLGSSLVEKVQLIEISTIIEDICLSFMKAAFTSISKENMEVVVRSMVDTRLKRIDNILKDGRKNVLNSSAFTIADLMLYDMAAFIDKILPGSIGQLANIHKFTLSFLLKYPQLQTIINYMKDFDIHSPDVATFVWGLDYSPRMLKS